ncbi:JmjC-domain-containing protein, partial [Auriscalpium vulgare]
HWGETKTWYGIPGEDAETFEAAIKREALDFFEAQPDLLFQVVTLMNPKQLTDAGVRVYACNQRAGELVITYTKAYHAGFNHGLTSAQLNFNDAVNFALPERLPFGRQCVQRSREHRKLPVFSHDELLITITQQSQSIATAIWLNESLQVMTEREVENRCKARALKLSASFWKKKTAQTRSGRAVDDHGFDCPEIAILKTHAAKAEELKLRARVLLGATPADRDQEAYLADCDRLLVEGSSINVYLDELIEVEKLVLREQLIHELDDTDDTMMDSRRRLSNPRARQCNLPHEEYSQEIES